MVAGLPGRGQTHKVAKPEQVVRAVGVYEWTGDMAKPAASRLIPVSLFIDGHLQDAGVYLARPVPLALEKGNVYLLQDAGIDKGSLDLVYARHLQGVDKATGDTEYEDGWFGYGSFQAVAAEKKRPALRASKTVPVIATGGDPDRPHFGKKGGDAGGGDSGTAATPAATTSADGGAADPDRPTMKRRTDDSGASAGTAGGSGSSGGGAVPADDPDRPTLKRRSAEDTKKASNNDAATVTATGSLNDDPNRPNLHRGKPASAMTEAELPRLVGLPPDLHQMAAVSDAANREPHEFARNWEDAAERTAVLQKMEGIARVQLVIYGGTAAEDAAAAPVAKRGTPTSKMRRAAPAPVALMDEVLKGYTLSYGGDATYVYTAHTAGTGAALRYVTVVAQADGIGGLKAAIQSVTDAAHLDRTARMRLVDAVDAEASNRASLLFELRSQNSRQFALYRVIAGKADQIFLSGSTQ